MVLAPQGFGVVAASTTGSDIELAPWSRVTATLPQNKKVGVQTMSLQLNLTPAGGGRTSIRMSAGSPSEAQEEFDFVAVPAGQSVGVSRVLWQESEDHGLMGRSQGPPFRLDTQPGVTHHVEFGPLDPAEVAPR